MIIKKLFKEPEFARKLRRKFYVEVHLEEIWYGDMDRGDDIDEFDRWQLFVEEDIEARLSAFLKKHQLVETYDIRFDAHEDRVQAWWQGGKCTSQVREAHRRLLLEIHAEIVRCWKHHVWSPIS